MKIYIAGGFSVMNLKGRERELSQLFNPWRRLFSYYFLILIHKSDILNIIREDHANKQNKITGSTRRGKARVGKQRNN
jgi:hypothetical protein